MTSKRRSLVWILLIGLGFSPTGARAEAHWDERDVEAAEAYRRSERARAERYRADVARREVTRRAPRVDGPRAARVSPRAGPDSGGGFAWWDRALADLDEGMALVTSGAETVAEWRAFWSAEVEPRWQRWRAWREREPESLAARLVQGMLGEPRVTSRED